MLQSKYDYYLVNFNAFSLFTKPMTENKAGYRRRAKKTPKRVVKRRRQPGRKKRRKAASKKNIGKLGLVVSSIKGFATKKILLVFLVFFSLLLTVYVIYLDFKVTERFEGRLWSVPSKVFARTLELRSGMKINANSLEYELKLMAYEEVAHIPQRAGQFRRWQNNFEFISRPFTDVTGVSESQSVRLEIDDDILVTIEHLYRPEQFESVRLDPALIGSIYPEQTEDRQIIKLAEVPERLINTLIAVEDRSFYQHFGVNPLAIIRALLVNIKAGEKRQGGSTLTQQLVKNLFLTPERSYWRKINEAIMAVLLEWHYDKDSILEAYLNEVYLGQNKQASVHGFGLGGQFYFNKPLKKLSTEQGALLIGLIKGPSYFNPRKNPQRALNRRNLVLEVMRDQQVISQLHYQKSVKRPLGVITAAQQSGNHYPAFIDLIKRQLRSRFSSDDLKREGLQIFTTLDPQVQHQAERSVKQVLRSIQQRAGDVTLQTAVVIADVETAEVQALIGGRDTRYRGFNRALDASRQIGSLIKPAIYLAALQTRGEGVDGLHLSTHLSDTPLTLQFKNGKIWQPQNYDEEFRGDVILFDALVHSYNVPSVRLGLKIGLEEIVNTLRNLGLQKEVPVYPSMLLGAFELSPFEVAGMYRTIAANGHELGLHSIRHVMSHEGEPLVYFAEEKNYRINEEIMYLLKRTLHEVTQTGTAKKLKTLGTKVAGKTGTTDDLRDSWFAGFSEDKLGVVWVGNDDNLTTGLTGASGALNVWKHIFQRLSITGLKLEEPDSLNWHWVDRKSGLLAGFGCNNAVKLPFLADRRPDEYADCE